MKNGILLSGGNGTRLAPLTHVVNKHLLGVDGKFIIDYPINTLREMGVENLTVVMGGNHFSQVVDHLKDGSSFGMKCNYVYQGEAKGIAQAINLCERFVEDDDRFAVILGDNIYDEPIHWVQHHHGAQVVLWDGIADLQRFGVASVDKQRDVIVKMEEKPKSLNQKYNQYAITGCYLFDHNFFSHFRYLQPSARGEYEVTDILKAYHRDGELHGVYGSGFWHDAGTHESIERVNRYFYDKKRKRSDIE